MKSENILITGITGQDGIFLTSSLIEMNKKANIYGISRGKSSTFINKVNKFNQNLTTENIHIINTDLLDKKQVLNIIGDIKPAQIYNLTGPSSVYESINKADFYRKSIPNMFNNLTESCVELRLFPSFFQASSSETFDKTNTLPLNENSSFNPRTPYAEAKYEVYNSVKALRKTYDWNIKAGIMFNHESEYREQGYLFSKIIESAIKIKNNQLDKLTVGSLSYIRDWSFAGDVADAMMLMNFSNNSDDFVIGSGLGTSIEELLNITFSEFNLDYNKYVVIDSSLLRIGDPQKIIADPTNLKNKIGWNPKLNIQQLIERCISFKLNKL